jgi:hypothetical protein
MTESAQSSRLSLVKPRSNWVITSKTKPTTPIDPLDQVNTPSWPTLGQRHGQTPFKPWCLWTSSGTFAAFSKFHLNTSKSTNMKVVQFFEGHNFPVDWHFQIWEEKGHKCGRLPAAPVHQDMATFNFGKLFLQIRWEKHYRAFVKVVKGSCWRKISTSCQAHSKPKEASLTHVMDPEVCQSIFLKLTKNENS